MAFRGFQPTPLPGDTGAVSDVLKQLVKLAPGAASLLFDSTGTQLPGNDGAPLLAAYDAAIVALENISTEVTDHNCLTNDAIEELLRRAAAIRTLSDSLLAIVTGQIDRRSAPALGSAGLARHKGHRTPTQMVKTVGRVPGQDVAKALRAGRLIHDTQTVDSPTNDGTPPTDPITGAVFAPEQPWLASVGHALTRGMSMAAAEAIQRGLGTPTEGVPADVLRAAAEQLCDLASILDPDLLFDRARRTRDELDAAGIGLREEERREKRSVTLTHLRDGMVKLVWIMDPETASPVCDLYDRCTGPRRGGPRHGAGTARQAQADSIFDDARTTEQLASDVLRDLLRAGAAADDSQLLGSGAPSVRVLTTHRSRRTTTQAAPAGASNGSRSGTATPTPPPTSADEDADTRGSAEAPRDMDNFRFSPTASDFGPGWIEGQKDPVSPETVARLACDGSTCNIRFDDTGQPLDVGREHRLFDRRQRVGIGARDGGCRAGNEDGDGICDRPPSWCEVHHVEQWKRDNGSTDIANGIMLCKQHHLNLHNAGWEIHRDGSTYWLIPPISVDPAQAPRRMASRSKAMDQLVRLTGERPTNEHLTHEQPEHQHRTDEHPTHQHHEAGHPESPPPHAPD